MRGRGGERGGGGRYRHEEVSDENFTGFGCCTKGVQLKREERGVKGEGGEGEGEWGGGGWGGVLLR